MDIDNDKRIDLVRSTREDTRIWRNAGADGFEVLGDIDVLGYDMAVDGIQMSDMNGDGLLDAVKLNVGGLRYRLNLGHGRWGDEVEVLGLPLDESELDLASLDDLNGDGLSDLVVVVGRQVKFAINRNGTVFSQITTLDSGAVDGELPLRDATVTVLMADVNGNGSTDVVWLDAQGQVTALELFPTRPNQLARIANSLGMVTNISYSTSVQEMARDGDWAFTLPHPMQVVSEVTRSDSATGIDQVTRYRYRDGFYDGEEKQFRGFAGVEIEVLGDDSQETGLTVNAYDVGAEDRYRHGRLLTSAVRSADRLINTTTNDYDDCPLAEVPATEPAIRFVCMTGASTVIAEDAPAAEHVTVREESTYDGYGNITLSANLGVVSVGGSGCAPCQDDAGGACGAACTGDEFFSETTFIEPGAATDGRWILGRPAQMLTGVDLDGVVAERRFFYDGPDYEGLAQGQLTLGRLTRVADRVDAERFIDTARFRRDADGNIVETLDPLAAIDDATHRARFTMDADGLRVVGVEVPLLDAAGQPYSLARTFTYESVFDRMSSASEWAVLDANGQPRAAPRVTQFAYDAFARLTSIARPGEAVDAPGSVFEYDLGEPFSRVITRSRFTAGGPLTRESIACMDGRGRTLQVRTRLADGRYQVAGLTVFNVSGEAVRTYQPYQSASAECDVEAPADTLFTEIRRDATGRPLTITEPDADEFGAASVFRNVFGPLSSTTFDAEDTDPDSPHADTSNRMIRDGLGRLIQAERQLADGTVGTTRSVFDNIGRIAAVVDVDGNVKRQQYDLLGRVLRVEDPNKAGDLALTYDDSSNLKTYDDGRGQVVQYEYDGLNRQVARFDAADPQGTRESVLWDFDPDCDPALCTNTAGQPVRETAPGLDAQPTVIRRGFDARNRLLRVDREIEGVPLTFAFAHNEVDQPTRIIYPGGEVLDYRYDDAGRLVSIDGFVDALEYDARGLLTGMTYANGDRITLDYDARARLAARRVEGEDGVLQALQFDRDRVGNLLSITDDAGRLPHGATFEYDAWYRTTRTAGADGRIVNNRYATNGNVVQRISDGDPVNSLTGEFVYDGPAPNAVTQIGDTRFEYDAAGNTIARGDHALHWDAMGRLRRVERGDAVIAEYAYGADHLRTARREGDSVTLYGAQNWQLRDGISTLYVSIGKQKVARVQSDALSTVALTDVAPLDAADGQITAGDAWAAQGSEAGILAVESERPISPVGALLESSLRRMFMEQVDTAWLHHDHLDSIVMATDVDGAVIGERAFEQTGAERADSVGYVDEFGFTGQQIDRATGLLHFEHRLLDPTTGRWMSPDPFFSQLAGDEPANPAEAMNVYGYVGNNYANFTDPTGLVSTRQVRGGRGNTTQAQAANTNPTRTAKQRKKIRKKIKRIIKKAKLKKNEQLGDLTDAEFGEIIEGLNDKLSDTNLAQAVVRKLAKQARNEKIAGYAEVAIGSIAVTAGLIEFFTPGGQLIGGFAIAGGLGTVAVGLATLSKAKASPAQNFDLTNPAQARAFLDNFAPKPAGEIRTQIQETRRQVRTARAEAQAAAVRARGPEPLGF
jgi:RHS repeat-associated protein